MVENLRTRRLEPLAKPLGARADGLPPARRLIVLPSRAVAGIPVEALLAPGDTRTVSYAPSATVFKYLREQPRPDRHAGLLALGDPVYERPDNSSEPKPLPDHGLLVKLVVPGSNAATHGLKPGDVLLAYNGAALHKSEDLKAVPEPGQPVAVEVWRAGQVARRELAAGRARRGARHAAGTGRDRGAAASSSRCSWPRGQAARILSPCRARVTRSRPWLRSSNPTTARQWPWSGPTRASPSWTGWPPRASWAGSASSTWRRTG